ncbi:MAG: hypothetical protein AAGA80_02625 [Cyanobacteria bacterium P01_F01_bin.143]
MRKKILKLTKKPKDFFLELDNEANSKTAVSTGTAQQKQPNASPTKGQKPTSQKKAGKEVQKAVIAEEPQPARQVYDSIEQLIVNAVSAKKVSQDKSEETGNNFATDYLIAKPVPNRRPGSSMDKFRIMSRRLKVRKQKV